MSFWRKLFGKKEIKKSVESTEVNFAVYRSELAKLNLTSIEDLEGLIKKLKRRTTKIMVSEPINQPLNSHLNSHFGGQPYFEEGEEWPRSKTGKPLELIFQIFNEENLDLPKTINLVQFYYDWDESPWDTADDGWLVKVYKGIDNEKSKIIDKPIELAKSNYCEITYKESITLPDWEGIDEFSNNASKLSCVLNEDEPWDSYDQIVEMLIGEQGYQSQLGGFPKWVQGESTPKNENGFPMDLLFQIDSEDNAGIMWGDVGLIYVFYDQISDRIEFTLQCH